MVFLRNPKWIDAFAYPFSSYEAIPQAVFDDINAGLDRLQQGHPEVSIVITAWNEEVAILRTVGSLAKMQTSIPLEVIVVDNNSTDHTSDTLSRLHVRSFFQPKQGWGPGRQMGLDHARGQYTLLADSDCIYPSCWANKLVAALRRPGVVSVYGRYCFISERGYPRWKLALLETGKDLIAELRHVKRPFLNSYGMSMGFVTELGRREGFYNNNSRGEDGRMCYDLMKHGKVRQVKSRAGRVWTGTRTLQKDGSLSRSLLIRIGKEAKRFGIYFNTRMKYLTPKE